MENLIQEFILCCCMFLTNFQLHISQSNPHKANCCVTWILLRQIYCQNSWSAIFLDNIISQINHQAGWVTSWNYKLPSGETSPLLCSSNFKKHRTYLNSSDARDGIFWLIWSMPCLLMPWLLKSPVHQQAWYWLCRTDKCLIVLDLIWSTRVKQNTR